MGRRLRALVGSFKDTASLSKAALLLSTSPTTIISYSPSSPDIAVLLATPHYPSSAPPPPRRVHALLAFGHGSRLAAAALARSLAARLAATQDASVALKCLLTARLALRAAPFILRDQLVSFLRPSPLVRSPLHLSAFRDSSSHESWTLSTHVRWLGRLLELLLSPSLPPSLLDPNGEPSEDYITALLNRDLLEELETLVCLLEEMCRAPDVACAEGSALVAEVVRVVNEDRSTAEYEIFVRVKELKERLGSLEFVDSVELLCLLRRLEQCRDNKNGPLDATWMAKGGLWDKVKEVVERLEMGKVVEERGRLRRDRASESARIGDRVILGLVGPVRFGSVRASGPTGEKVLFGQHGI